MAGECRTCTILASYAQSEGVRSKNSALPGAARCALASLDGRVLRIAIAFPHGAKHSPLPRRLGNPRGPRQKYTARVCLARFEFEKIVTRGRG